MCVSGRINPSILFRNQSNIVFADEVQKPKPPKNPPTPGPGPLFIALLSNFAAA